MDKAKEKRVFATSARRKERIATLEAENKMLRQELKLATNPKEVLEVKDYDGTVLKCDKKPVELYPQDSEDNEFRYLSPAWLNELAKGLTAGAVKHPGETWRTIPAQEHVWRAVRHCVMWLMGDRSEPHLVNAGMRVMMAWETAQKEDG